MTSRREFIKTLIVSGIAVSIFPKVAFAETDVTSV